jgi:hypothetical protein
LGDNSIGRFRLGPAVYASTDSGGIAVPTNNTIRAGLFAQIAAVAFLATGILYSSLIVFDQFESELWDPFGWITYMVLTAVGLFASVLGLLTIIRVGKRLGGLGLVGMIGFVITGLGTAAAIIAWALPFWMGLQGVGYLVFGIAALRRHIAPLRSTVLVSSAFLIGPITAIVLTAFQVGWEDSYGDYPLGWAIGGMVGVVLMAIGLFGWAKWLRSEEPPDIDTNAVIE